MKKVFAVMVVFAALFAVGCAEKDTMPPPAEEEATPAEETTEGAPADDTPTETP